MNPITRKEMFLAAAGGQDVTTPTPITREEVFLDAIAKGGGGGGGTGGVLVVNMVNGTLDKTWQEIHDAGFCVITFTANKTDTFLTVATITEGGGDKLGTPYQISAISDIGGSVGVFNFSANAADDYPTAQA